MGKLQFSELIEDLFSAKILPIISMSVVIGVLLIIFGVSFASMIFSGDLAPFASRAAGLTLAGCFFICLISAFGGSFKGTISLTQDAPTAVLSGMAVSVAAALGMGALPEVKFMTITATIVISTVFTGLCFAGVGKFRLANLLRFMPYPVVGGFLAGTGWLLVEGSIGVMCDVSLSMGNLALLTPPETLIKWLPGIIYGAGLFIILQKRSHFLILPGSIVLSAMIFYGILVFSGTSIQEAKTAGFLVSGVPAGGLWPAFSLADFSLVQWPIVFQQFPGILTVALVSIIGMLLNMSGIELAARNELDMNKELMVSGAGNIIAGLFGSPPGYPAISLSLLGNKTNADSRLTGIISALILGFVLFFGGNILEYFPKPIIGGLVLLLGLFFIYDWIIVTRKRLPLTDWLIVISIFLVVGIFGFREGAAFGLVATLIFFVFRFSRVPVVKQRFTALERRSMKVRSAPHRHILNAEALKITGCELTGYLFFGSASTLTDSLKNAFMSDPAPLYMILDLEQVSGFDISAVNNFQRVIFAAKTTGAVIVITTAPKRFMEAIQRNFSEDAMEKTIRFFQTLDNGLEWCEDRLIRKIETALLEETNLRDDLFDRSVDDVMKHLDLQEYFEDLIDRLEGRLTHIQHPPGSIIMKKEEKIDGFHLLVRGNAIELNTDSGLQRCCLETGCVIAGPAAFVPDYICASTFVADSDCKTAFLSTEARKNLEKENPALAIELYGYLLQS